MQGGVWRCSETLPPTSALVPYAPAGRAPQSRPQGDGASADARLVLTAHQLPGTRVEVDDRDVVVMGLSRELVVEVQRELIEVVFAVREPGEIYEISSKAACGPLCN